MKNAMGTVMKGAEVYGSDNEKVGKVVEVGRNSFKVEKGFIFHKDMHLPLSAVAHADEKHVHLRMPKDQITTMGAERLPAEGHEWYGTTDRATASRTDRIGTDRTGETMSVPVIEEELRAGVREKEAGMARVSKTVTEEEQTIDVPVSHEEVHVTQRAVNRAATKEDMAMMDRDIEVPLRAQEVVTQKQAVVTGEVNIRKETVKETQQVTDTVRREEVHVENPTDTRTQVAGHMTEDQQRRMGTMSRVERERYDRMTPDERVKYERENPMR